MVAALIRLFAFAAACGALWNIYLARLLWKEKKCASTIATMIDIKSEENVRVGKPGAKGSFMTVPHSSTGTYVYTVDGKDYRLKGWQHVAPEKLPKQPRVVYLVRFPRHAYLDCELMYLPALPRALIYLLTAIGLWLIEYATAAGLFIW